MAELARREPDLKVVGIDPNHAGLIEVSRKANAAAKKGGLPNALFVLGSAEDLPGAFEGRATSVSVLFPWGSLLRAAALPERAFIERVAQLCAPGAKLEVVYSFDARDAGELARLGLGTNPAEAVADGYATGGFAVQAAERLDAAQIREYPTTWARKLAMGSERVAVRLEMVSPLVRGPVP